MFSLHPRATLVIVLRPGYRRVTTIWGLYRVLVQLATTARLRQASRAGTSLPLRPVIAATLLRPGWGRASTTQGWYRVPVPVSYTHLRAHETRHDLVCR